MADCGPAPRPVPCGTCGTEVDALRAPRVRCIDSKLWFFCSPEHAETFDLERVTAPWPQPVAPRAQTEAPPALDSNGALADEPITAQEPEGTPGLALPPIDASPALAHADYVPLETPARPASDRTLPGEHPSRPPRSSAESHDSLLLGIAAVSGCFSLTLALAGSATAIWTARLVVAAAGCGVLIAQAILARRDPRQLDPISSVAGPVLATLIALFARVTGHSSTGAALTVAGALVGASASITWLVQRLARPIDEARSKLTTALALQARRLNGHITEHCAADELRPGEEVLVEAGELVPVDGTVLAGQARVVPWLGSERVELQGEGDPILAGAKVLEGALRVVAGWTGSDRAWLRLTTDRPRRVDLHSSLARAGYLTGQRGSCAVALLVLLTGFAVGLDGMMLLSAAAAGHAAFAHAGIVELGAIRMARAALEALHHGIAFQTARHLDDAGRVTVAALCARGTVLLGEPEVTSIEPLEGTSAEELLAWAAGAESAIHHPVATAVLRAARARDVRADATRNPNPVPGLGVTAVTSTGKSLVVGSRALMLREKISVARAEQRITELESVGRAALLVAVDGRLTGILSLQDGLRAGARAAVQHLLDIGIEPVLLSGDSRETTEAVARSIDIEHVRPDLPASQRGDEIKQLADGGAVVAVIGRSPIDDVALGAADVSVTLRAAAASNADFGIGLATDDVRDAARALRIARCARDEARAALALTAVPPTLAILAVAFGLLSPALMPAFALFGTGAAYLRSREN